MSFVLILYIILILEGPLATDLSSSRVKRMRKKPSLLTKIRNYWEGH
ncbi:hypothetical protein LINPERPRIM_LOCUS5085 [Linum perenne]